MASKLETSQGIRVLQVVAAISLIDPFTVRAQDSGQQLAIKYRRAYHRTSAGQGMPPPVTLSAGGVTEFHNAPGFRQIAGNAGMDRAALRSSAQQSHYPIPGQVSVPQDRKAIIA